MWREAVLLLALAPLGYYALATLAALRFFGRERTRGSPITLPGSVPTSAWRRLRIPQIQF